jgi:carbon starvation protein
VLKPVSLEGTKLFAFPSGAGPLLPIMFITVACGAISGFHSLVSSGTTSKQLASERHAKKIGYGAMVVEAMLATIALFCVAFGLKTVSSEKSAVELFALGFSKIVYFFGDYGVAIGIVILNAFILTTLDTATRITRFLTQELFNIDNKWIATTIVILAGGYLGISGKWQALWPIFGASNQLVAALALIVISAWLLSHGKNYRIALIPAFIMLIITLSALVYKAHSFYQQKDYVLLCVSCILIVLSGFVVLEFRSLRLMQKNA